MFAEQVVQYGVNCEGVLGRYGEADAIELPAAELYLEGAIQMLQAFLAIAVTVLCKRELDKDANKAGGVCRDRVAVKGVSKLRQIPFTRHLQYVWLILWRGSHLAQRLLQAN